MTAHERLRQLHANATPGPWHISDAPYSNLVYADDPQGRRTCCHPPLSNDAEAIATLRNALPQLANLAEAAAEAVEKYAPRDDHWSAWNNQDGNQWQPLRRAAEALADLEQALNPTGNTQSPT